MTLVQIHRVIVTVSSLISLNDVHNNGRCHINHFLTQPSSIELIVHTHEVVILIHAFNLGTKQGLKIILQIDREGFRLCVEITVFLEASNRQCPMVMSSVE
jgi:hypothetical protein